MNTGQHTTESMRRRLMRLQWLALVITGVVCGVVSFALTWRTVNELRDHTLEQVAQSVVRHGLEMESDDGDADPDVPDKGQFTSQIWTQDGALHYTSTQDDGPPRQQPGWHRLVWQQQDWHVYTLLQDGLTIQVSQPSQSRSQTFWQVVPELTLALTLVTAGLYGLLHLAATASLKPLATLRQQLDHMDPMQPQAPWQQHHWPKELQPLVDTLGHLFERLASAREAQQHLVARAAHEFRTPLAALKIHAQLLGRSTTANGPVGGNDERHREHLLHAVDRLSRLVDQLLRLAEFDAMTDLPQAQPMEVEPWIQPAVQMWAALAKAHGVAFETDIPAQAQLHGHAPALHAALDNVVHNAVRHSPAGQRIGLHLLIRPGSAVWRVVDHGPGMTTEQRQRAGQTFASLPRTHADGSGLGLAIAKRVVTLHGGMLQLLETPGGGLTVELSLPQPGTP